MEQQIHIRRKDAKQQIQLSNILRIHLELLVYTKK